MAVSLQGCKPFWTATEMVRPKSIPGLKPGTLRLAEWIHCWGTDRLTSHQSSFLFGFALRYPFKTEDACLVREIPWAWRESSQGKAPCCTADEPTLCFPQMWETRPHNFWCRGLGVRLQSTLETNNKNPLSLWLYCNTHDLKKFHNHQIRNLGLTSVCIW